MIDRILIRPILKVATFIKRNPLLALLLLALLFILPPLTVAITLAVRTVLNVIKTVLGIRAAEAAARFASSIMTWMQNNSWACPGFALAIGIFSPLVGGLLTVWCFVDKVKKPPELIALPEPTPVDEIQPEIRPETGSVDDVFNDQAWV